MGIFGKERDLSQAPQQVELRVDCSSLRMKREEVDIRLDAFLAHHLDWRSRSSWQAMQAPRGSPHRSVRSGSSVNPVPTIQPINP